jgi:2-(1,2-epoxy-1,2-dihydrophenyl)acetyl-CoA isomerase
MSDLILVDTKDGIATLTLNRPEVGNAFATESYALIAETMRELGHDENVRCIVITGAGKFFSAGGDIKEFKTLIETKAYIQVDDILPVGDMVMAVRKCPKPVIAMINGAAAGAGAGLALACDFRYGTAKSKIILAFINLGFSGDTDSLYSLSRIVGTGKTTEIMALGDPISGEEALRLSLLTKLCEEDKLVEDTYAFAQRMASKPTLALGLQKQLMQETFFSDEDMAAYHKREAEFMSKCSYSADFEEAVNAFLEKRPAVFQGK